VIEIEAFGVDDGVVARLRALDGVDAVSIEQVEQAHVVAIQSQRGPAMIPALLAELGDIAVGRVVAREPTLEDAYVELVSS
jgi:ABC-2 type transport system ATP-binding protein